MRAGFRRHSVSLDANTKQMCRVLAVARALSISAIIRLAVRQAYSEAMEKGEVSMGFAEPADGL